MPTGRHKRPEWQQLRERTFAKTWRAPDFRINEVI